MHNKIILFIPLFFATIIAGAQIPDLIPSGETEPLELTPFNIIVYIVLPVIIFIIYFMYRKSKRKNKND